jgi:hypothetical protein
MYRKVHLLLLIDSSQDKSVWRTAINDGRRRRDDDAVGSCLNI